MHSSVIVSSHELIAQHSTQVVFLPICGSMPEFANMLLCVMVVVTTAVMVLI
jgi:hypothetical protein